LPSLSEMDEAEVEGFLEEMLLCFPVLGLSVFHKPVAAVQSRRKLFLKGKGLSAEGYESPEGFVVLAGGRAAVDESLSAGGRGSELRKTLCETGVLELSEGAYTMVRDFTFSSPSQAATVMLGRAANGRVEWKDSRGITLKELQQQQASWTGGPDLDATQVVSDRSL
jgi:hypothetical protein